MWSSPKVVPNENPNRFVTTEVLQHFRLDIDEFSSIPGFLEHFGDTEVSGSPR